MKREIKVRVWNKERKCMIGSDYPNWANVENGYFQEWYQDWARMCLTGITEINKELV